MGVLKRKKFISVLLFAASGKAYRCVGLAYAMHHGAVQSLLADEVATCSGVPNCWDYGGNSGRGGGPVYFSVGEWRTAQDVALHAS